MYDSDFFLLVPGPGSEAHLDLLSTKTAAEGIDAIFLGTKPWKFDCSEFSEVVQLYALRESLGRDAAGTREFNRMVKAGFKSHSNGDGRLQISPGASMSFLLKNWYTPKIKDGKWIEGPLYDRKAREGAVPISQADARHAEVGSLVTFGNTGESEHAAWRAENAISLGNGQFVAWGLPPYIVDAQTILNKLASESKVPINQQAGTIFIDGISVPNFPWIEQR